MNEHSGDTIVALASGSLPAAIAIVRISGPDADAALRTITPRPLPAPRRAVLRGLIDPQGDLLDHALVLRMPGPESATGEDVVELHCHGGRAVVARVVEVLTVFGLRRAEPGEFTRRALLNGRIGLAEAEGIGELVHAETEAARRAAAAMAGGRVTQLVDGWRGQALHMAALIEAAIEYGDDEENDVEASTFAQAQGLAAALSARIERELAGPSVERLRDGIRVVLLGAPNAGKSSLLNRLVDRDVAIVSPIAGTTRDAIEIPVRLDGIPFVFIDTAGLRDTSDPIEAIGVERAARAARYADVIVRLDDTDVPTGGASVVIDIAAKADLGHKSERLAVSSLTGAGVSALVERLLDISTDLLGAPPGGTSFVQRQRDCASTALRELTAVARTPDPLLGAEHARAAVAAFDELLGRSGTEAMLDALFSSFCIGK